MKVTQSCPTLRIHGLYSPWNSPGQNTGVGSLSLFQGVFPTQGLNPGLPHCRHILYQLSHQGSPWILEWVAYPFSRGSSWPRSRTGVSYVMGGFSTSWAAREAVYINVYLFVLLVLFLWRTLTNPSSQLPLHSMIRFCTSSQCSLWGS